VVLDSCRLHGGSSCYSIGFGVSVKLVTIKQNSRQWHDWRGKGLGASDAPAIMGQSPYQSAFALWGDKTGLLPREEPNAFAVAAMQRGRDLEPVARALYEQLTGRVVEDLAGEHDTYPFIRASFDGIVPSTFEHFVEIKCPGQEAHDKAKAGKVPDYYYPQVQQQFLVSGAKTADYFSYRPQDPVPHVVVPVVPDLEYQKSLLAKLTGFWAHVQDKTPPPVDRADFLKVLKQAAKEMGKVQALLNALMLMEGVGKEPTPPKRSKVKLAPKPDKDGFYKVS
jgi:putative phage-type endonuclease